MTIPLHKKDADMLPPARHAASFRDPAGFVFHYGSLIYRQVNDCYCEHYEHFIESGLYAKLAGCQQVISHTEVTQLKAQSLHHFKTLLPQQLPFISYPYEWSFSQLKDAALLTLQIMKTALKYGMVLKDATPYNIQFHKGKPIHIDTLSSYREYHL